MDLEEKVKAIPKEIYDDILELCEITFMKGRTVYAEELLPEKIIENTQIWEFFRKEEDATYTIYELQTYLALEKMIKKDKRKIQDILEQLYEEWSINDEFNYRRFTVMHQIVKFSPKEFNKDILYRELKKFLNQIDVKDDISIVKSFIDNVFMDLHVMVYDDWSVGCAYGRIYATEILNFLGFDILAELRKINYKDYEIILKNLCFKNNGSEDERIEIKFKDFLSNEFLVEILYDSGFVENIVFAYNELVHLIDTMKVDLEKDYWGFLGEVE